MKKLEEMTNEELWQLFPIILTPHSDNWGAWYRQESEALAPLLPKGTLLSHMGSTAVAGIWAKPIVDIMAETPLGSFEAAHKALLAAGYRCMCSTDRRRDYNKGYTQQGFDKRVFHLHLRTPGDNKELYFRDYLIDNPDAAQQYQALKLSLWKRFEHDRDAYTEAKGEFINACTAEAEYLYAGRYQRNK